MGRPTGVTVISVLWFVLGGLCALGGVLMIVGGGFMAAMLNGQQGGSGAAGLFATLGAALGFVFLAFAALYLVVAWGLMSLKSWARIVGIVLSAIGVLLQLPGLFASLSHFNPGSLVWTAAWIAVDIAIIVYLLKPEVKAAFEGRRTMMATA